MDAGLKMLYEMMYRLDVDSCVKFEGDFSKTGLSIDDSVKPLTVIRVENSKLVAIENSSTKEVTLAMAKKMKNPKLADRYIQLYRGFYVLKNENKPFGWSRDSIFYNPFPSIIDNEEWLSMEIDGHSTFMEKYISTLRKVKEKYLDEVTQTVRRDELYLLPSYHSRLVQLPVSKGVN